MIKLSNGLLSVSPLPESLVNRSIDGPSGAVVLSDALIANRFSARFVDVTGQTRALANLAGMKRARQRGRGVEFDEVRAYAAGDDVRAIDSVSYTHLTLPTKA